MRSTKAPCHVSGVALSKVELIIGGAGDMSLKVKANLVDRAGSIHATTERVGGWSENVVSVLREFVGALEGHLVAAHFDEEEGNYGGSAERETPAGILDADLGSS